MESPVYKDNSFNAVYCENHANHKHNAWVNRAT